MSPRTNDLPAPLKTLLAAVMTLTFLQGVASFKFHSFCNRPPVDMQTRFPLYRLEVNTKITGIPWAYRQNNTLTVSVKALYQKYKIKRIFMSVPKMVAGTPEKPAHKKYLGQWKWQMQGGVIPIDCKGNLRGQFSSAANAVRDLWWYKGGFYNVTAEWDPLNTIANAYLTDMVNFEVFVSPDPEPPAGPTAGPPPENRWVKLESEKFVNLDYIDLHRYLQVNPQFSYMLGGMGFGS